MTYAQLKNQLSTLTDEQLTQPVRIWSLGDFQCSIYDEATVVAIPRNVDYFTKGTVVIVINQVTEPRFPDQEK